MYERQNILTGTAHLYACLSALAGIGMLAVTLLLIFAFGMRSADWQFLAVLVAPAAVFIGLAPSIWRQKEWAMVVVLVLGAGLRAMLGYDDSPIS